MFDQFRDFFQRIIMSKNARLDLNVLAGHAPTPDQSLRTRVLWLIELIQWIRLEGHSTHQFDFSSGEPQAVRVKYLLQVLDRNPEWKDKVSAALSSILLETRAVELFMNAGISERESFLAELTERILRKVLPQPPNDQDLATFFSEYLKDPKDVAWISSIDTATFEKLLELFDDKKTSFNERNFLLKDAKDAIVLLGVQIRAAGLSSSIRLRLDRGPFTDLPFFKLPLMVDKMFAAHDRENQLVLAHQLDKVIDDCFLALAEVKEHLDESGVNISIVYMLAKMESQLTRLQDLSSLVIRNSKDTHLIADFITQLIAQNARRHSIGALLSDNFSLVSRKIAERSAETGEHYITRSFSEYVEFYRKALGGGLITTLTTLVKYSLYYIHLPLFLSGIAASINYSLSFLAIHFAGFTLGTKQPAMTAPALAAKMHRIRNDKALEGLVDEIVHIIRSQFLAVLGNVIAAVPTTFFICSMILLATGKFFVPPDKALYTMKSFSILSMTPFYAAFTGILLWLSSLVAGWMDNWFAYRKLSSALSHNRRVVLILGETRARGFGMFLKRNVSGIAGNVSLAVFLGMTPVIAQFMSLPIDVRHVTLSSASLAAAAVSLPSNVFTTWDFWLAIVGIASMGVLNISVSFTMAMFVAIRARNVHAPERGLIYYAVWRRLKSQPLSFLFPPKSSPEAKTLT